MLKNVWYIIVHKDSDEKRTRNLIYTCNYIKSLGFNVLVIEHDEHSKIKTICDDIGVKHEFIKNSGLFNRAWAFNCFRNFIDSEKVFLADNDIIIEKEILYETVRYLDVYDVVRPFNGVVCCYDDETTKNLIFNNVKELDFSKFNHTNIFNISGGLCAFRTDSFYDKLKGFDERFEGWGGEDDEMHNHILKSRLNIYSFNNIGIHLFHERKCNEGNWQPHYKKNLEYIHDGKRNQNINIGNIKRYE